jgi:internalin A
VAQAFLKFGPGTIKDLPLAERLSLSGSSAGNLAIILRHLPNLQLLKLTGPAVTDLASVTTLGNLRWLTVSKSSVTDFSPIGNVSTLRSLQLVQQPIDILQLKTCTSLIELYLWNGPIQNLPEISHLHSLERLSFSGISASTIFVC